jgi:hypothetical protein
MEIKTSIGTVIVVGIVSYFIGKYKGNLEAKEQIREERLNRIESLLTNT